MLDSCRLSFEEGGLPFRVKEEIRKWYIKEQYLIQSTNNVVLHRVTCMWQVIQLWSVCLIYGISALLGIIYKSKFGMKCRPTFDQTPKIVRQSECSSHCQGMPPTFSTKSTPPLKPLTEYAGLEPCLCERYIPKGKCPVKGVRLALRKLLVIPVKPCFH